MNNVNRIVILVLGVAFCIHQACGIVDFCAQNTFSTNSSGLQLIKEASSYEYALENKFKGLHCCAKGYRSIEWYKDGKAYPWPSGVSNLILYPASANQTIYTLSVSSTDTGNYTCLLRNDTHVRTHTIHLHVFDKIPDTPKITYESQSQEIALGESVRLFCEAFVGRVDLPDAHNDAAWKRPEENGIIKEEPGIYQEKVTREEGRTLGAYLVIEKVTKNDYGEYVCRISKPDKSIEMLVTISEKALIDQTNLNPIPWKKMAVVTAILVLIILTTIVLNMQYGLTLRVWFKDRFGILEEEDGKLTDILICYSTKDADIVLEVLIPKLESKYHYKCSSRELSSNVNYWHLEMAEAARKTRRLLAVLSPDALNDNWEANTLYQALKQLLALCPAHSHPITCITLKSLPTTIPQIKNAQGETLISILRADMVHVISWRRADKKFWLAIRLGLPPKRYQSSSLNHQACRDRKSVV